MSDRARRHAPSLPSERVAPWLTIVDLTLAMSSIRSVKSSKAIDVDQEVGRGNAVLRELLRELALTLVPRGMTPKVFGEISRHAFVHAAARISRQANGRINHSRVAALTGLSRAEVKRILLNGESVNVDRKSVV